MRIIPILTAIIVTVALYFAVMERDKLLAFATGAPADAGPNAASPAPNAQATPDAQAGTPARPLVRVFARHSKAQVVDSAVVLRGETQAARSVDLRAETAGQVVSEPLRKGSFVQQGQVLCQIDAGTRPALVAEARARLAEARARVPEAAARVDQARAQLKEAELNRNAASKLSKDGFASETRLAATEAAVSGAKAAVETALRAWKRFRPIFNLPRPRWPAPKKSWSGWKSKPRSRGCLKAIPPNWAACCSPAAYAPR